MKNQNEILEVIAEIKRREVKLEETISSVRPELVEMEWKQLIKIRRYRNELEKMNLLYWQKNQECNSWN